MARIDESSERWALSKLEAARTWVANKGARAEASLFPFAQLQNADVGDAKAARKAFEANRRDRSVILPYLGAWSLRSTAMGACLSVSAKAQAAGMETTGLQAAFALAFSLCAVSCVVLALGWIMLGRSDD